MTRELQEIANKYFSYKLLIDGKLGKNTRKAIDEIKIKLQCVTITDKELLNKVNYYIKNYDKFKNYFDELFHRIFHFANEHDYDWLILMTQFALETNYGKDIVKGSHNLGNIKAIKNEDFVEVITHEFYNGEKVKIVDKFRKYENYEEFLYEYDLLINSLDRYLKARNNKHNAYMYFRALKDGGYATDPEYVDKNLSIYNILYTFYIGFYR